MTEKSYVTMEQQECWICLSVFDTGALLLDRRLRERFERHTLTGHGLCPKCLEKDEEGYVALIVCDAEKTQVTNDKIKDPADAYRTGEIVHVRRTAAKHIFNIPIPDEMPFMFCDEGTLRLLKEMSPDHPEKPDA